MTSIRRTLAGFATAGFLLAGCVADTTGPQRTAMWKTHGDGTETDWLGRPKKPKASPQLYITDARLAEQYGNHEGARKSYEAALGSDPRSFDAILGIARLDQFAGRTKDAERGYQKALQMRPKDPDALDAAGQFYASQKRWPEALRLLNEATLEAPNDAKKRFHLAVAMCSSGDVEGSLPHFAKTCGEAEAHYNVAWILNEQGNVAGAEKHLLAAVVKRPDLSQAQALLDDIQHAQGRERILPASQEQPRKERRLPLPVHRERPTSQYAESDEQPFGAPANTTPEIDGRPASITPLPPEPGADAGSDELAPFGDASEPPPWNGGSARPRGAAPRAAGEPEPYRPAR